ncbi:flavin reductase family protein [Salipiger sp. P9]|uniref:flavin reductase family protein n=1 Tax=Salipiger pentaromativorans TaxID=2943193 RepID=UPI00215877F1|nr:flavin reductase family protein [Salipiger pentaromativorans]MCR8550542.1 flavin reductase family protein [Salipiger pentaromativorans]
MGESLTQGMGIGAFWQVLGERAIGATVVTTRSRDGRPNGFLGLSTAHVSASPPTLLVSIDRKTSALADILESGRFAVNFLAAEAMDLAAQFGKSGPKPFDDALWESFATGAPVLRTALGLFDCEVSRVIEEGDVAIVIGKVAGARSTGEGAPLIFFRGAFQGA